MTPIEMIAGLLQRQIGLAVESVGVRALEAAVSARMRILGLGDQAVYVVALEERLGELPALIEEVVVPESWFMRDRLPFLELAAHARARRRADPGETYRVLSIPCSSGEEPYSVAMALLEEGHPPGDFSVLGVDISSALLDRARAGVYFPASFRAIDPGLVSRWFDRGPGDTKLAVPSLRAAVRFQQCNILDPGFLVDSPQFHAILCRNLLIYLTAPARRVALARLEKLLVADGILIAGHAEALEVMAPKFRATGAAGAFTYTRRSDA
ncbi:MAG TPA: protein-glutamate O-methyltransferase CheR, partial [Kofleriaceae bacterium]|nr:protein-glutamate O-methyltransferase CheR [Kofleriaceae bacterium]